MRRALIAVLMGATMVTPVAASAQTAPDRAAARAERQEQRQAERQARQARPAEARVRTEANVPAASWPGQRERTERIINRLDRREDRQERREDRQDARRDRRDTVQDAPRDRRDDRQEWRRDRRDDRREWRQDRRDDRIDRRDDRREWNRRWRSDNRYDWQRWRNQNRSIFSIGRYHAPYRHNYNRFSIGLRLGSPFYSSRYWISDPWQYRLPPAYAGTRWVRYHDDVLLVDLYTGEVLDVIHDFFW